MKLKEMALATGLLLAPPLLAADKLPAQASSKAAAHAALSNAAVDDNSAPTPPTLPDEASQKARDAHANIAFGKKGAEMKAAHSQSGKSAQKAADEAADRAAKG